MSFSAQAAHDAMEQHIATTNNDSDREEQTSNAVSDSAIGGASLPGEASGQSASSRPVTPTSSDMSGEAHTQPPPRRVRPGSTIQHRQEELRLCDIWDEYKPQVKYSFSTPDKTAENQSHQLEYPSENDHMRWHYLSHTGPRTMHQALIHLCSLDDKMTRAVGPFEGHKTRKGSGPISMMMITHKTSARSTCTKAVYRALSNRFEGVRSNIEQRPTDSSVGTELSRSIDASSRVHPSSKGDLHRELNRALKAATNVYAHASASMPEATTSSEVYASDLFKDYVDEDGTRTGQTPLNLKDDEHGFQKLMYDATARSGVQEGFTDIRVGFTDTAFGHTWKQLESGKRRDRSLRGLVGDPIDSVFQDPKTSRWALRQQLEDEREDQQSHRPGGDQLGDVSESERSED